MSPARYFKEVVHQAKKVKWPSFNTFITTFGVILAVVIIASLVLWFETWVGIELMKTLENVFAPLQGPASTPEVAELLMR